MPEYNITTSQGKFRLKLDREPSSEAELRQLAEQALRSQPGGQPRPAVPEIPTQLTPTPSVGRSIREPIRQAVSELPFLPRTAVEVLPAVLGSLINPLGGGVVGEGTAQLTGVAPESKVNLGISAIPFGRVAEVGLRGARALFRGFPGVRQAASVVRAEQAVEEGGKRVQQVRPSGIQQLYEAIGLSQARVVPRQLPTFQKALDTIQTEALDYQGILPEKNRLLATINQVRKELASEVLDFPRLDRFSRRLAHDIRAFKRVSGEQVGGAKLMAKGLFEDLSALATTGGKTGDTAKLLLRAKQAVKLDKALDQFDDQLARAVIPLPGRRGEVLFDATKILTWLGSKTDPRFLKTYDQNFVTGLGAELPKLKEWLTTLSAQQIQSMGPGALQFAQRMAKVGEQAASGLVGLATGGLATGGPIGAAVGGYVGLRAPGALTDLMLTAPGRAVLGRALHAGRFVLTERAIQALAQGLRGATRGGIEELERVIPGLTSGPPRG